MPTPTVVTEDLATQGSLFAPLDKNVPSGYNYLSIRRNRYWKQTLAAWSSIDAFCSSIYGRKNPGLSLEYNDSPTDGCAFREMQSPFLSIANGDQSADMDLVYVNESQNRLSDSDRRVDDSDGSVSVRNFDSKSSRLVRSSSDSSLARDVTLHRSTSTTDATPSTYMIRYQSSSEVYSRNDNSQVNAKDYNSSSSCHLQESSSATIHSNYQRMAVASGSSSSSSCLDPNQVTSQDPCIGTSQNAKVVSSSSVSKQSAQKVSYSSCKHREDNQTLVDSHSNDVGRNQSKLCGVCQQPYINHSELLLLSPGLFRQRTRSRRIATRKAKNPTNRRWLYRRRNDMYNPHIQYCSFLASNFLLAEAVQTWLGHRFQGAKSVKNIGKSEKDADKSEKQADKSEKHADKRVKDADDRVAAEDSSVETETFSESVKSKLYELLMQIKSRISSDSSATDVAEKVIASGADDVGERNTIPKDDPEDIQKVDHPDDRYIDTAGRGETDADLKAASRRRAIQRYATSIGALNSAAKSRQKHLEDNLSNAGSIPDHQDMSNTRQKSAKSTDVDYNQDVFLLPRKSYIEGSKRKRHHASSKMKLTANSQRNQENPDSKIATTVRGRHYEKSGRVSDRKRQRNENVAWEILEDESHRLRNKEKNYLQQKNYIDGSSRYEFERVDRRNMVVADEGETEQGRRSVNNVKENMAYDTTDASVKKYHYKCVTIEGRETILKFEHDSSKICNYGNVSKTDQPKKNKESVVEEYACISGNQHDRLGQQSTDGKVESVKTPQEPADPVKYELEKEKNQGPIPCREPKLREGQVEAPTEVGDGDDQECEEVEHDTMFHKKQSVLQAEKERRILRRFAREPTDDVKIEPESERKRRRTHCREPKTMEAQVEEQAKVADGKDKVGGEVKYSKVFHKKYSGFETEKERRMLRRIAREQLKAHLEKEKLEGETASLRSVPSWSQAYVKLLKRRQKHSNKQCIIGKQVTGKDNFEESQQKADEEQIDNVEERQQKADAEPTKNAQEKVQESIVDIPQTPKPQELARYLPGLGFFERIFRIPVTTQMTPASKLEVIDPQPLTHAMATGRAAYLSTESQDVPELSAGSDRRAGIKSSQYTDNTHGVATDNEETIQEVESEIFQVPLPNQLTPKRKFQLDNPPNTNRFQTTIADNSKDSLDIPKRFEKIGKGEGINPPVFEENLHVEKTNTEATGVKLRSEKGHFKGLTQLTPERTCKIDKPSSMKTINTAKASQDIFEVSKKPVKETEIKSPGFRNNLVEQRDKKITRQMMTSEIAKIQETTHLSPVREFKLDNPNNTKKSPTTKATNLKSDNDVQQKFQKINMDADKKSSQRKANMSVKQPNRETDMQFPGNEVIQQPAHTQLTPKRKFKIDSPSNTKNVKTVSMSQQKLKSTNKSEKEKDIKFPGLKVKTLFEQTEKEIKRQLTESEAHEAQVPTLLSPKGKFKIYSQSYNTKLKASSASFFSKTIPDYSKSPKNITLSEDTTPHHFKDAMSVQQTGIEAITEIPGSETPDVLEPTKLTPKRKNKKRLPDGTKKLKASNEADFSKANPETTGASKEADIGEEMDSRQFEEMLVEHHEAVESEEARPPDSPESADVDAKDGDLLDTAVQKVEAGDTAGEESSVSQDSLLQQIYNKLLLPVGMKIINDLEQLGHTNRPLKYRIPASHTLYPPPASRPVYLSEFLTWLGVKQTDDSSSDDEEEENDEKPYDRSKRNKYDRRSQQGFPQNVKVADSFTYLRTRKFDNFKNERNAILSPPAESSFISQGSLQMYVGEGVSEGISSLDTAASPLYEETSQTLSDRKEATTADSSNGQSDKPAADDSLTPLPESKVNSKCVSSSKVFHKKYSTKRKLLEKEMLGGQSQVPWTKKERIVDEGTDAKRREKKKEISPKCLFAKQAERTRQKEKREKELKQCQGKISQKKHFKKGQKCSLEKENVEELLETSDIEEKPCRACMSSEEYYKAMEKFSSNGGGRDQNGVQPSRESVEDVGELEEVDPGMLTPLDQDVDAECEADVREVVMAGFPEKQGGQQTDRENRSVLKAITQLLREIPIDVLNKKLLKEIASFQERNTPLKFKIPSTNERVAVQHAEPIYLSQLLALLKTIRSRGSHKSDEEHSSKTSQASLTQGGRLTRPELLSRNLGRAGSLSHQVGRRSDHVTKSWSRAGFLSVPMGGNSLSREVSYVSNIGAQDDDMCQSVSHTASDATETVTESNLPELSQTEPAPDESIEPHESPSKIFHKQFSTEGKLREKEILGSWGKQTCKEEKDTKDLRFPCRDPPVVEEPPPKKNVFSKQAEKTEERELQEKEFEKEYAEFFGQSPCPSLKGEDESAGGEIGEDIGGDDLTGVSEDAAAIGVSKGIGLDHQETYLPLKTGDEEAMENNEVKVDDDPQSSSNPLLQEIAETLVSQQRLTASVATEKRTRPYRYAMPSAFEMYQPPEARPIYMARETSDKIMTFLGLHEEGSPDIQPEDDPVGRRVQTSADRLRSGVRDVLEASPPYRALNALTQLNSQFFREGMPSRSTTPEYRRVNMTQFSDFQSSVGRGMRDYSTRAINKVTSLTSQRGITKAHVDSNQRSPSVAEAIHGQLLDMQASVAHSVRDYATRVFNKVISPTSQKGKTKACVDSTQRSPNVIESVQSQLQEFRTSLGRYMFDYNSWESNKISSPTHHRDKAKVHLDPTQRSPSAPDDVHREFQDFRTQEGPDLHDFITRDFNRIGSPTKHRDKTRVHVDSRQRSPSPIVDVQREFGDRGFERYQGSKGYNIGSPGLEVLPEEVSQLDDPLRSGPSGLFRWVGKSRFEKITQPDTLEVVIDDTRGLLGEPERLAGEVRESSLQAPEAEQRKVQKTEPYFKGKFPEAFEESTFGSIALRILNEIVEYGKRNVPLKYEARPQQFLEMPAAAKPMYISRKDWDSTLGYIGLGSSEGVMGEDGTCESESTTSIHAAEPASALPAVKHPYEDSNIEKRFDEDSENNLEDDMPKYFIRGGIVESHRELTFYCPPIPLPKRFRSVSKRRCHRFEHDFPTTSRAPFVGRETICYGRTKQLKRRCDVWSTSELDRSSHFCRSGRYYRKNLFRKKLNLRNILSECGKSKEWKRLEDSFKARSEMVRYGCDKNVDSICNEICDPVRKYGSGPFKKADNITNCQSGLTNSMKCDFLTSSPRFRACSYDSDRCSNYREDDPWAFPDSRMALDMRPEAQGDYLHHTLPASRNCFYGSSENNARKDAHTLLHSVKVNEGSHELLSSFPQFKSNAPGILSLANTPGSFAKSGILRSIAASKRGLTRPETNRWRGSSDASWGGCHINALPLTTAPTLSKLERSCSFFDSSRSEVVKYLGLQKNRYGYRDVKTQCPFTSSYYSEKGTNYII